MTPPISAIKRNVRGLRGQTSLHFASAKKKVFLAELLLKFGADVNAVDVDGRTPLCYAVMNGWGQWRDIPNDPIVDLLIKKGAKVNVNDNLGRSPLFYEIQKNRSANLRTVHLLLLGGADPNIALHMAASFGHATITKLLVDFGAKVDEFNSKGLTALQEVFVSNRGDTTRTAMILVDRGALPFTVSNTFWFYLIGPLNSMTYVTTRIFLPYTAILIATGRYNDYRKRNQGAWIRKQHWYKLLTFCNEDAHLLNKAFVGETGISLAEFLLLPSYRARQLIRNQENRISILSHFSNFSFYFFRVFIAKKLELLDIANTLHDFALSCLTFLHSPPLPRLVCEKILSHLTELDYINLAVLIP